jgi:hypothetical protein
MPLQCVTSFITCRLILYCGQPKLNSIHFITLCYVSLCYGQYYNIVDAFKNILGLEHNFNPCVFCINQCKNLRNKFIFNCSQLYLDQELCLFNPHYCLRNLICGNVWYMFFINLLSNTFFRYPVSTMSIIITCGKPS